MALVKDRVEKLKPLSHWRPVWCRLEARLTQPVISRYRTLYPKELEKLTEESWAYTWKARENSCEITPLVSSPMIENHKAFLENAICTLLQTHWVNSPFDEMPLNEEGIVRAGDKVQVRASNVQDLGLYLDPAVFKVVTKTKSRGVLTAVYSAHDKDWLPESIGQRTADSQMLIDQIEYADEPLGGRRLIQSFWLSVGAGAGDAAKDEDKPAAYTQVTFSDCRNF